MTTTSRLDAFSGARRLAKPQSEEHTQVTLDDGAPDRRCKANWAWLIQKVYEVDPLEYPNCGTAMRIISLIDDAAIIERILRHLKIWDPGSPSIQPAGRDPP